MAELRLGPLLRYVDGSSATIWVEASRPCTAEVRCADGTGGEARTFQVAGPPLRAGAGDRPDPGHDDRVRGAARRRTRLAAARLRASRPRSSSTPADGRDGRPGHLRLLPLGRAARRREGPGGPGRPRHPRGPHRRGPGRRTPGRPAAARRPGVRGRGLRGHPPLARGPPRPRGPAGRRGRGLRGVHPPLLRVLARPRDPLAAVHRAQLHDLRRPRRHRRLEHQRRLGRRHAGHPVVARADAQRPDVVLGLPAPRQPLARANWPRTPCTRRSARPPTARTSCAPSPPQADADPASVRWSYRRDFGRVPAADGRHPRGPRPRREEPRDARPGRGSSGCASRRWTEPGSYDHLLIGTSLPWLLPPLIHDAEALERGAVPGRTGRALGAVRGEAAPARPIWSTGRRSRRRSRR